MNRQELEKLEYNNVYRLEINDDSFEEVQMFDSAYSIIVKEEDDYEQTFTIYPNTHIKKMLISYEKESSEEETEEVEEAEETEKEDTEVSPDYSLPEENNEKENESESQLRPPHEETIVEKAKKWFEGDKQ